MKITILSGSPNEESSTLRFSKAVRNNLNKRGLRDVTIIDFAKYDIPLIANGSVDENNLTTFQKQVFDNLNASRLVFMHSPEYNWMPSAEIVNFFHQLAGRKFKSLFDSKTFALAGVSSGRGGNMPCIQMGYVLNKIINHLDLQSMVSPRNFESQFTNTCLDEDGNSLGNADYDKGLDMYVDFALRVAIRWHK